MKALLAALLFAAPAAAQSYVPLTARVNIQADSARMDQIIDGQWVGVGINKPGAIGHDFTRMFGGKPSYRFELGSEDNTLSGYAPGETKGRAELSYCYATAADFAHLTAKDYSDAQKMKTVYHHGKGICPQGVARTYTFSVYIPSTLSSTVTTIFAQWHGMPDRTLVTTPTGEVKKLPVDEFVAMQDTVIIKKDTAYERVQGTDKKGRTSWKAGKPTGWLIEQGGYPPLAFGFSNGYFYIKANSDRRWFTDKTDRCNIDPAKGRILQPATSEFKASTIAYSMPFEQFPKDCWVTFTVEIDWTRYGGATQTILKPGQLDVRMACDGAEQHIVDKAPILIGRNDEDGYYFKFGIYRVANSSEPVSYNLAGYSER